MTLTPITSSSVTGGIPLIKYVWCLAHRALSQKDNEEDEEEKKNCHDHEYCLIHSLLPPGCRSPDVCTAHSCARHCLLHFIQGPFSFCSPVSRRTPRATRFGFPRRLFPASVNHSLSDSQPLLHYRGAVTEYEPDFLITATPRNLNPVRKRPLSVGQWQIQELIRLVPRSHSR